MSDLSIIIPAAGFSSRMHGTDKLMMVVDGVPWLRRIAEHACTLQGQVIITLNEGFPARRAALIGLPVDQWLVERPQDGMSASIITAMRAVSPKAQGVMIVPADMPDLDAADLQLMQTAFQNDPDKIYRGASVDAQPGHPVIFPRRIFSDLCRIDGDNGARSVLDAHSDAVVLVGLPAHHALVDLDTGSDWENWHRRRDGSHHQ